MEYRLYKIKPGKRDVWLNWCKEVIDHHLHEAIVTLKEEGLVHESCMIFGSGDDSYVLYKHQPAEGKKKKKANFDRELNKKHFEKFYECLEKVEGLIDGYTLDAI
ncbi:MAG: DUF6176 family protein [Patescibacteria group bacterium]